MYVYTDKCMNSFAYEHENIRFSTFAHLFLYLYIYMYKYIIGLHKRKSQDHYRSRFKLQSKHSKYSPVMYGYSRTSRNSINM
jgi:hypothetical protein